MIIQYGDAGIELFDENSGAALFRAREHESSAVGVNRQTCLT
jgi:hypothetical protein